MINDYMNKPNSVSRRFGADIKTKNNSFLFLKCIFSYHSCFYRLFYYFSLFFYFKKVFCLGKLKLIKNNKSKKKYVHIYDFGGNKNNFKFPYFHQEHPAFCTRKPVTLNWILRLISFNFFFVPSMFVAKQKNQGGEGGWIEQIF